MYNVDMAGLLFNRSCYTLLESLLTPDLIATKAKEYGYTAVGICDRNFLGYAPSFMRACRKVDIKPLFLLSFYLNGTDGKRYEPCLLAKDDVGFAQMMCLASDLDKNDGCVEESLFSYDSRHCFLFLFADDMPMTLAVDMGENIHDAYEAQKERFPDALPVLCDADRMDNRKRNGLLYEFFESGGIPYICGNRCYYLMPEDYQAFTVLKAIKDKKTIRDKDLVEEKGRYMLKPSDLVKRYPSTALSSLDAIIEQCHVSLNYKTSLPQYETPQNADPKDYLSALCHAGLLKRLKGHKNVLYEERLRMELKIINEMGFTNYFLIVFDYIRYAKKHGILVGPGRGSAAGSLAAYCLGITDIDPIRYGLIFERFLNPERISMPDIDVDFPDDRRDEVIAYVKEKYGPEHVAHIITYGTLKAKQVLRDVGRVLEYPLYDIDALCKCIPFDPNMTLQKAYKDSPSFKRKIESEERFRELYRISLKLEGFPRHASTHAAGIVMSEKKLNEVIPTVHIEQDLDTVQYTMEHLEAMGLIKMDFLGLRNLSIISEIVDEIKKEKEDFLLPLIPLNDHKTFDMISQGNTLGVFQLESSGMTNLVRRFKPQVFEEIALCIALFRPGPMQNIPQFIENRAYPQKIHYLHPDLKPILEDTYGIIVYQEQIMTIAQRLAGFSFAKADILRKAMSKKKEAELVRLHDDFISGCRTNHYAPQLAEDIYDLILKFANYGFNKSHSVAYGLIAYQMAYLKANYPLAFYKALLNGVIGSSSKTYEYLQEIRKIGIEVLCPDINRSNACYSIESGKIRMPFAVIKEVGKAGIEDILKARGDKAFASYGDAVARLSRIGLPINALTNLILSGAFDGFKETRQTMIQNLPLMLKYKEVDVCSLFGEGGFNAAPAITAYADTPALIAKGEYDVFGFYFSVNPILSHKQHFGIGCPDLIQLQSGDVKGFALIQRVKEHRTKKGEWMAFLDVSDGTDDFDLVVMPNMYKNLQTQLKKGRYIVFSGKMEKEKSCLVREMKVMVEE